MRYGLAHEAQEHKHYRSMLTVAARTHHVILDNAADELGEGMSGQGLFELVEEIHPRELILPDVLQDGPQTIENSLNFYEAYKSRLPMNLRFMVVPQGKTFEEYMQCFSEFKQWGRQATIGIPYDIEFDVPEATDESFCRSRVLSSDSKTIRRAKRRLNLLRYLSEYSHLNCDIHLLGMNNLAELRAYQRERIPWIRSNDTTAPFAAASVSRRWRHGDSGEKDWPALDFSVEWTHLQKIDARQNLFEYIRACDDIQGMYNFAEMNTAYPSTGIRPEWDGLYE